MNVGKIVQRTTVNARTSDPETSHAAGERLQRQTMLTRLLGAFNAAAIEGLTAEEAAMRCGYDAASGAWKRVSDLLTAGLIEPARNLDGTSSTRRAMSGRAQRVLVITDFGRITHQHDLIGRASA